MRSAADHNESAPGRHRVQEESPSVIAPSEAVAWRRARAEVVGGRPASIPCRAACGATWESVVQLPEPHDVRHIRRRTPPVADLVDLAVVLVQADVAKVP